ncbi:hypothetical protein R0G64_31480, partial [Pseudomonas otitidis]
TLGIGVLTWLPVRGASGDLKIRDGYLITALFWTVLGTGWIGNVEWRSGRRDSKRDMAGPRNGRGRTLPPAR